MSLETSIEHMKETDPEAIKLFCLIGLLPGGCTESDLNWLWGNSWNKYCDKLLRASLLNQRP